MMLFMINIEGLVRNKVALAKNFHIQPSEIDKMSMWEYEMFMKELNEQVKEENDKQQGEMKKYNIDKAMKMSDPSYIKKQQEAYTPKIPSMNMSLPKF